MTATASKTGTSVQFQRATDRYLRFGFFYPHSPGGEGTLSSRNSMDFADIEQHRALAAAVEDAGFDYLFLADKWDDRILDSPLRAHQATWLFAVPMAAMLVPMTRRIGIISTVHVSYFAPILAARAGAMIDALSGGRWGINVVSGDGGAEGLVPEPSRSLGHDARYELALEYVDILKKLWSGDPIDHDGKFFKLQGQLVGPQPVQRPWPAIISAGASPAGKQLATRHADYLFVPGGLAPAKAAEVTAGLDEMLVANGRKPDQLKLQINLFGCVRDTESEAEEVLEQTRQGVDPRMGLERARFYSEKGWTTLGSAFGNPQTEAEIRDRMSGGGMLRIFTTPQKFADKLIELHQSGKIRGVALRFPDHELEEAQRFSKHVFPLLEEAGVWVSPKKRGYSW